MIIRMETMTKKYAYSGWCALVLLAGMSAGAHGKPLTMVGPWEIHSIDPASNDLLDGFDAQAHQVFRNLRAVCQAAGSDLDEIVRIGVFLTDMANFARFNQIMSEYFSVPYPARAAVQVAGLPKGGVVEADAILVKTAE